MMVKWTTYALADLQDIRDYIANDSERYASVVVDRILVRVVQLEAFPMSGQMVPEYGREDIREIFLHSYRIIHQVLPDHIRILTVVHGSRTLPAITGDGG